MDFLHGVDISHHNEKVDLPLIAKSQAFVFLKATEGLSYVDPTFAARWLGLKLSGAKRGAYHFFRADKDPIIQARHFCETVGELEENDLPLVLDMETMDGKRAGAVIIAAQIFLDEIERLSGKTPIIYSGHSFIVELNLPVSFAKYPLWLARYTIVTPAAPAPWKDWMFWQYSENKKINGVSGDCDVNYCKGFA